MDATTENPILDSGDGTPVYQQKRVAELPLASRDHRHTRRALHRGTTAVGANVVMECEEQEGRLAEAQVDEEDLHVMLSKHVTVTNLAESDLSVDDVLRHCNMDPADDYQVVTLHKMKAALVKVTGSSIDEFSDQRVLDLMHQVDRDANDQVTVAEFKVWWQQRLAHAHDGDEGGDNTILDSHAVALARMQTSNMLHPNSTFRKRWDVCQAVLIIYLAFACPYRVSFDDTVELWSGWFVVELFIDLYFIMDVCLNFRTAIITKDGEVLYKQKDVSLYYMKTWFALDLISCLPLEYVAYLLGNADNTRLLRMFKLVKLLRLVRIKRILDRWEEDLYSTGWLDGLKLIALILVSSHWICCAWFFVGCPMPDEAQKGWVARHYAEKGGWQSQGTGQLYLDSAFFSLMAVIMIGATDPEGNIYPYEATEKLMYSGAFLVGAVVMSLIIGNMSDLIANANPGQAAQKEALGLIHAFCHHRKLGRHLTARIRNHYSVYYHERGTTLDLQELFRAMPTDLQIELAISLRFITDYKAGVVGMFSKVPFLKTLDNDDLIRIGTRMRHQLAFPPIMTNVKGGEGAGYIMKEGERGNDMWIVSEGTVRVERLDAKGDPIFLGELRTNDAFGELAVLVQETVGLPLKRGRSAYAQTSTVMLLALSYHQMQQLRQESYVIDLAVRSAIDQVYKNRPTIQRTLDDNINETERKVESLREDVSAMKDSLTRIEQLLQSKV